MIIAKRPGRSEAGTSRAKATRCMAWRGVAWRCIGVGIGVGVASASAAASVSAMAMALALALALALRQPRPRPRPRPRRRRWHWRCVEGIQSLLSLPQWEPALCAENRKTNEFVCVRVCGGLFCLSCQLADIKAHRSVHKLKKRQPERWSSQPLHGSKMSILGLKDHFSRDPVQVQSLDGECRDCISNDGKRHWPTALQDTSSETNKERFFIKASVLHVKGPKVIVTQACVGSCSQANYLLRNSAMDDSIGGS